MHSQVVSKRRQTLHYFMVVASGRADRVLARPLFCRLHMHMHTLNACGVVCTRTSKPSHLGKWLPIIVQISLTKKHVALGFQSFWFSQWPFLTATTPRLPAGTRMQLSSYVESEITSFVFQALSSISIICSTYCHMQHVGGSGACTPRKILLSLTLGDHF